MLGPKLNASEVASEASFKTGIVIFCAISLIRKHIPEISLHLLAIFFSAAVISNRDYAV